MAEVLNLLSYGTGVFVLGLIAVATIHAKRHHL